MVPSLTRKQIQNLFAKDDNGRYIDLIIPFIENDYPEITLTGKSDGELVLDEIIRLKQYASLLYENRSDKDNIT